MTKKKRPGTNETKPSRDDDAKIGRGSPPRHTQFKKGKSGNPKGRPKGSKNLSTLLMTAANDQVAATISGKPRKISKLQATTMQLATKAASGDMKAMVEFLDRIDEVESRAEATRPSQYPLSDADLEVIQTVFDRLQQHDDE